MNKIYKTCFINVLENCDLLPTLKKKKRISFYSKFNDRLCV